MNRPPGRLQEASDALAARLTRAVGSMACAAVFALLACVSLPAVLRTGDPVTIVAWTAQTFLQLVLLPIIMVGQQVTARAHAGALDAHRADLHTHTRHLAHLHARLDAHHTTSSSASAPASIPAPR